MFASSSLTITNNNMTTAQNIELNAILDSQEFNQIFDFESERKEIQEAGWTYEMISEISKVIIGKK